MLSINIGRPGLAAQGLQNFTAGLRVDQNAHFWCICVHLFEALTHAVTETGSIVNVSEHALSRVATHGYTVSGKELVFTRNGTRL